MEKHGALEMKLASKRKNQLQGEKKARRGKLERDRTRGAEQFLKG